MGVVDMSLFCLLNRNIKILDKKFKRIKSYDWLKEFKNVEG